MFKDFTAGGQKAAHGARMFKQVIKNSVIIGLISTVGIFTYFIWTYPPHQYIAILKFLKSIFLWEEHWIGYYEKIVIKIMRDAFAQLKKALVYGGYAFFGSIILFSISGKYGSRRKKVRTKAIFPKARIKNPFHKGFFLGKASLSKGSETRHILVSGGTGSGKTNAFNHIIPQIRTKRQKAVIIDTNGTFVNKYYDQSKDFILNPFDERGEAWHPWIECIADFDYEAMAKSFIPSLKSEHDSYWKEAAASVFCALLEKQKNEQDIEELIKVMLRGSLEDLADNLSETEGTAHIDPNSEKTASSIRSVISTQVKCLKYLKKSETSFSIRKWIQDGKEDSFLFLSCASEQREALKPLLSAWYSISIRSLMQLSLDPKRRVWLINDELPSLDKVTGIETCLTEGRKYGACSLIAIQSPSQLEEIYGRCTAKTIIANCNTKIVFKESEPSNAKQLSNLFGEHEVQEVQEGVSYGSHQMRDGVNQSKIIRNRPVISSTDIQNLKANHCFLKSDDRVQKVKLKFIH